MIYTQLQKSFSSSVESFQSKNILVLSPKLPFNLCSSRKGEHSNGIQMKCAPIWFVQSLFICHFNQEKCMFCRLFIFAIFFKSILQLVVLWTVCCLCLCLPLHPKWLTVVPQNPYKNDNPMETTMCHANVKRQKSTEKPMYR